MASRLIWWELSLVRKQQTLQISQVQLVILLVTLHQAPTIGVLFWGAIRILFNILHPACLRPVWKDIWFQVCWFLASDCFLFRKVLRFNNFIFVAEEFDWFQRCFKRRYKSSWASWSPLLATSRYSVTDGMVTTWSMTRRMTAKKTLARLIRRLYRLMIAHSVIPLGLGGLSVYDEARSNCWTWPRAKTCEVLLADWWHAWPDQKWCSLSVSMIYIHAGCNVCSDDSTTDRWSCQGKYDS